MKDSAQYDLVPVQQESRAILPATPNDLLKEQDLGKILRFSLAAGTYQALAAHLFLVRLKESEHGQKGALIKSYADQHGWKRSNLYHKAKVGAIVADHLNKGIDITGKSDAEILRSAGHLPKPKAQAQKNLIPKKAGPTNAAIFKQQIVAQKDIIEQQEEAIEELTLERDALEAKLEHALEMIQSLQEDAYEAEY